MAKLSALLARAFDFRAAAFLTPVLFFIALDVVLTLLGQSADYWSHFFPSGFSPDGITLLKQHQPYWHPVGVSGNELALFGFGSYLLRLHPFVFFGGCALYMLVVSVVIVSRIPGRTRLIAFQVFTAAHAFGAFTWIDETVKYVFRNIPKDVVTPQMWVWLAGILYTLWVVVWLEFARHQYYARMNKAKSCDLPDCQ